MRAFLIGLAIALPAAPAVAVAQPPAAAPASQELREAAEAVVNVLRGTGDLGTTFAPGFLAQVPEAQINQISASLAQQHGAVQALDSVQPRSATAGTIRIRTERAILVMDLGIEPQAPHRIVQLLVTGVEPIGGDSFAAIMQELRELPGQVNFAVARLDESGPTLVASHNPDQALAIGSTFKLIILGEISRQVGAGRLGWDQVVPIERHSLPSGLLQDWPLGSPVTVHTLAGLMISRSDNTATDALLRLAGRDNVERMMATMGMRSAARNRPFLTTMEAFQLKAEDAPVIAQWRGADEAARRRMLRERYEEGGAAIDVTRLGAGTPLAIDTVEWFASAADLARVMDWLRRNGDETTHGILAISPGMPRPAAAPYSYLGFKGGSEAGVINLTWLVRNNEGAWHVVTASWNNPAAPIDEGRFIPLVGRALPLVR
ncbi:serine hydrolase [Sphingosinicella sp. YJ22]|uniref:serine hydrolase n=1 Tax=Sphingosinicella sp. YJ22 TaxID=1104780 RepID=UPI0014084543|nr:serine hydrolase [Sphingosinicella sp. YJ22]